MFVKLRNLKKIISKIMLQIFISKKNILRSENKKYLRNQNELEICICKKK